MFEKYDAGAGQRIAEWDVAQDCTVRTVAKAMALTYNAAWELLYREQGKYRTAGYALSEYLRHDPKPFGVMRYLSFPAKRGTDRMNARSFVRLHPTGSFILRMAHHFAAVVDGTLYDTWDSSGKCVYVAWQVDHNLSKNPSKALSAIRAAAGKQGGIAKSRAKAAAARANGRKGGRPLAETRRQAADICTPKCA